MREFQLKNFLPVFLKFLKFLKFIHAKKHYTLLDVSWLNIYTLFILTIVYKKNQSGRFSSQ